MKIQQRPYSDTSFQALQAQGLPDLLARLLASRTVSPDDWALQEMPHLLKPQAMTGCTEMAALLADAIQAHKRILIIGDYDADGATATSVAMRGLTMMGANVDFLVPNRFEYGYGLTPEIVALASQQQPDVILTVDNGIASIDGVQAAKTLGMQVLITDHHLPAEQTPAADCIVNPNQRGCTFPSKHLAGVGVIFYVLIALRAELKQRGILADEAVHLGSLLDLVALGTVADLVKLDANNRILVQQGLKRIRQGQACPGILAILQLAGRDASQVNAQDLGFYVGPRLNAAGRLDDMTIGIRCLLATTPQEAMQYAQQLHVLNAERKQIEAEMQWDAMADLTQDFHEGQYTISVFQPDWHQGVIGILASRIKEQFHRPVIAFAEAGDGLIKGSGRSIAGLHLRDALDMVTKLQPDLILKFGGHAMAAGLSIRADDFPRFQQVFEQVVQQLIDAETLQEVLETDGALAVQEMTLQTAEMLGHQVWGQGFPPPLFYDAFEVVQQRVLGEKHLKLRLQKQGQQFEAIYFRHADLLPSQVTLAYALQVNEFNGARNLQLQVIHAEST
ncbi:single-stranded-DNA-specific exonuclease [Methylophilus rhizosphaerae]|uniref:Single-stranded-DNA-specific exonuclease RecJ n=1 Tax=Methylophilus rhizosphaerae TaxID=492660 RepID=A0A1G8ZTT4_9PROT|nr:single-stranded-DNA-specific exonuclease RecJ [Methylophilus rhizosphaerae]SDK18014.1 single-stranded-DNA-specific exonuclease [Methylophilus rhizosphaerae]